MAPGRSGTEDLSAKNMFDRIGKIVHAQMKTEAQQRSKGELKGSLSQVSINSELNSSNDPCTYEYDEVIKTNGAYDDERYPCGKNEEDVKRFSDTLGGQCTDSKISGNKYNTKTGKDCGACAPYRRLHLCNHNLESIETNNYDSSNAKHKLLAEVCYAAKYEGDSLRKHHGKHKENNEGSRLCTELARSFADIGDIIRGKDLFRGNDEEKKKRKQLDEKLKDIFKKIYEELSKRNGAKQHYQDDNGGNFFKLREDWWEANRQDVWKALTCNADGAYFHATCSHSDGRSQSQAKEQCRCKKKDGAKADDQVPTYFDYVPQFLRWFEEWAEDFCRLRKKKLEDAKNKCRRVDNGQPKYCDLNRHDCVKTIRGKHVFVEDYDCMECHFSCSHFVKWLDNQKLEFNKQVKKYETEISNSASCGGGNVSRRKKRNIGTENYDGYEKKFYDELKEKSNYGNVDAFLGLLNKETTCTNKLKEDEEKIDFKKVNSTSDKNSGDDGSNKTFYRTKYCEACPWCGAHKDNSTNGKWEDNKLDCAQTRNYKPEKTTTIEILTGDKTKGDMVQKYSNFCTSVNGATTTAKDEKVQKVATSGDSQIEKWECYYEKNENKDSSADSEDINFCVLQDGKEKTSKENSMHYNSFFWLWVYHMLHDSVEWRTQLGSCINKDNGNTCKNNKCKGNCECYEKWVAKKKKEWENIKNHFNKQDDIENQTHCDPGVTLAAVLQKKELLESLKDVHVNAEDIEHIKEMLDEEENQEAAAATGAIGGGAFGGVGTCGTGGPNGQKSIIDKILKHEEEDAETCKNCQPKEVRNPCSGNTSGGSNKKYPVVAQQVAQTLQGEANRKMLERSVKNGDTTSESVLKANASKGQYRGSNGSDLKKNICNIDKTYSNADGNKANNPCDGKGEGFTIGEEWKNGPDESNIPGVYIPPRRRHICTSNVEYLLPPKNGRFYEVKNGKCNHSFLGDVLLAAKYEAENIKKKYEGTNYDQNKGKNGLTDDKTVCRALKSSFADIGDIIRGKDLWDKNTDARDLQGRDLQGHLEKIFKEIKGKDPEIKEKYANDKENTKPPYKQLRADWWEANRDQVWNAMKCAYKKGGCGGGTPYDDYIPQRLRWMTEWAEWYCKYQSQEYDKLMVKCSSCTSGKCEEEKCTQCEKACDAYQNEIKKWEPQWKKIKDEYEKLYQNATTSSGKASNDKDQEVVEFLNKLQNEYKTATKSSSSNKVPPTTTPNTPYATAAGYIHQEARTHQCLVQNEFCEYKNGVKSSSGDNTNENYAFKKTPPDYKLACDCNKPNRNIGEARSETFNDNVPRPRVTENDEDDNNSSGEENEGEAEVEEEVSEKQDEKTDVVSQEDKLKVCSIVDGILTKDTTALQDACRQKYQYGKEKYTQWRCISDKTGTSDPNGKDSDSNQGAICIPPRRRKLYIGKIKEWAEKYNKETTGSEGGDSSGKPNDQAVASSESPQLANSGPSTSEGSVQTTPAKTPSRPTNVDPLLAAFVESAAIETFFLWHQYKQLHKTPQDETTIALPYSTASTGEGSSQSSSSNGLIFNNSQLQQGPERSAVLQPFGAEGPPGLPSYPGPFKSNEPSWTGAKGPPLLNNRDGEVGKLDYLLKPGGLTPLTTLNPLSLNLPSTESVDPNDPSTLSSGVIPPSFLRQMFYTLGDYRDILVRGGTDTSGGKDSGGGINIVVEASDDKEKMKEIQNAIDDHINKLKEAAGGDSKQTRDKDPSKQTETPVQSRQTLWQNYAPQIWKGMICALTYKDDDSEQKGENIQKIVKNEDVKYEILIEKNGYTTVKLENSDDTQPMPQNGPSSPSGSDPTINNPKLINFVKIPTFFRYLHEWGTEFCGMRARLLKDVKKACRKNASDNDTFCSGDGHVCTEDKRSYNNMSDDPDCPDCYEQCRKYRKWIDMKFVEYQNQKNKYEGERGKITRDNSNSGGDGDDNKKFCQQIKEKSTSADFLGSLKHCTNDQTDGEQGTEEQKNNEINFEQPEKTFSRSTYCETCPYNIVKCNSGGSRRSGVGNDPCTEVKKNGETWEKVFKGMSGNGTTITVQMIDRRGPFIKEYLNKSENSGNSLDSLFKASYLFKSVRTQNWECRYKDETTDVCKLTNFKDNIDLNEYTTFKVFLIYWLEDFLYGYYILKKRKIIAKCTQGEGKACSGDEGESKNVCACVKEWVDKKNEEWGKIKKHFENRKQESGHTDMKSSVRQLLEILIPRMDLKNGKRKIQTLSDFLKAYACKCLDNEKKKEGGEDGTQKDIVECLLDRLQTKATSCKDKHSGSEPCTTPPSTHVGDVEDEEEENPNQNPNEAKKMIPKICGDMPKETTKEEPEEKCEEAPSPDESEEKKDEKKEEPRTEPSVVPTEDSGGEQTPVLKPEEEAPAPEAKKTEDTKVKPPKKQEQPTQPRRIPRHPLDHPLVIPALSSSTLMWSIGISFAALTYWFLKKKSKSSVDLLRVLQIPQNDYGIPTLKSSNKYIPYGSGKYRGKRYIYLEGDSGTDSGYTDHYSDITSSSESEYEELDINDIYVPHAPKYKTLIEVVLEPSGKTQNDDIPNSGKNTPSDDTPTNKLTDIEWNELKQNFISNMLQNIQPNDLPNDYKSGDIPMNTQPNTLYFDKPEEKPFIMSIHDRNLLSGEEYSYDMINNIGNNDLYSGQNNLYSGEDNLYSGIYPSSSNHDSYSGENGTYSGTDLINDSLNSGNQHIDIYDEILKRKENELFGTNNVKQTSTHSVAKLTYSDPIHNQLELFHKWLDRHRDMCEKWENHDKRLSKLKEEWDKDNNNNSGNKTNGNITPNSGNTPPNSDIPSGKLSNIHSGKLSDIHSGKLSDIPSGKLSDIHSGNKHSDIHSGKLSGTPSDNNIHSDIQTSDIPSGKLSDTPSGKLSDIPSGKLSDIASGNNIHSDIHPSDIPSGKLSDIRSGNKTLNSDVSIQIDMNNPKTTNEFTYVDSNPNLVENINPVYSNPDNSSMDTILEDLDKPFNEPYYYDMYDDDIYYDVNDDNDTSTVNPNNMEKPTKIQIELDVNTKLVEEKYLIGDVWDI
ncbi:erythrocyte membrane protein 1, PfEMP1, putative [Plasmodium reichenowi]|uniref:Erythrocyte membrane protein 1, PfEMP1, putative n=1 Tax=Plasmodium reichenowi TaxID=5854 RepID=A0A060RQ17_PLARE|nr:erythrocyte membrane protein 1, PfEMP1, putative [Plasmodium reichenowi]